MILPADFTIEKYGLRARFVEENDAEFILTLRTDERLNKYLHPTKNDMDVQKRWIRNYKEREREGKDYYFIFFKDKNPIGLNRIYDIHDGVFRTGSWLFSPDAPFECSIAASIMVRELAFDVLGFIFEDDQDGCHVDNKKVMRFNHMMGLKDTGSYDTDTGLFVSQSLTPEDFAKNKPKMLKYIGIK